MTTNNLYQKKQDCCGCELCSMVCPKQIIEMREDEEGFLYPQVKDESACINCNRCISVCPVKSPGREPQTPQSSCGGFVNDLQEVKASSSGGFATAIGKSFINCGGIVYGVRYSSDCRSIVYDRAETLPSLDGFRTSKYAQAYKKEVYLNIQKDLKEGKKVLFVGLPCEVSALYHLVHNPDNLYTISLICHGPTSQKVHRQFCDSIIKKSGADYIDSLTLRHKKNGWRPYFILAHLNNGAEYMREFNKTDYDIAFQFLKRPSCSVCQYKLGNTDYGLVSDLVLGDYHAVRKDRPEYNSWGVSQATALTDKGYELISFLNNQSTLLPINQNIIASTNIALWAPIPFKKHRNRFSNVFCDKGLHKACNLPIVQYEMKRRKAIKAVKRLLVKVRNIVFHK